MRGIGNSKLAVKVLFVALPFLIVSIALTGAILSSTNYGYFMKAISRDYRNIIKGSAGEIHQYMANAGKNLEGLCWVVSATKLNEWQEKIALAAFNHIHPEFISLSLMTTGGEPIASTGTVEKQPGPEESRILARARSGENAVSQVLRTREDVPFVQIAIPVLRLGEVREILLGELNLKSVWYVLEGINVGRTGEVYIIDLSGRLIGHRDMDRVLGRVPAVKPGVLRRLKESVDPIEWREDSDSGGWFCLGCIVADLGWVVVLRQSSREIYGYLYKDTLVGALATLLVCLIAILVGRDLVRRLLAPIDRMHQQVKMIGRGDLDQKLTVTSGDEIGELCRAFNDMTDSLKKLIAREIETAKELAHARNLATLGVASSKVTHEVGNLLNNIGMVAMMLRAQPLDDGGRNALELLERESLRIGRFIGNFLQFAKRPELVLQRASVGAILREALDVQQLPAREKGIIIDRRLPADLPPLLVDVSLLYQVLSNLLKNSLEAMDRPGRITVEGNLEEGYVRLTIRDSGPGIEPEVMAKIFEPFYTTKGKKGTGLGLSICKSIIEAHRGSLECRSTPGEGAAFTLRLPVGGLALRGESGKAAVP
jgi:signal transduction histidine kinase